MTLFTIPPEPVQPPQRTRLVPAMPVDKKSAEMAEEEWARESRMNDVTPRYCLAMLGALWRLHHLTELISISSELCRPSHRGLARVPDNSRERGFEGLVAKDPASPYVSGRTLKWLKVKQRM